MRTIKFRTWDKDLGMSDAPRMIGFELINEYFKKLSDSVVFMQFTGLLDKNGKEIYEGDIVQAKNHQPSNYLVEFIEAGFCCRNPSLDKFPIDLNHFFPSKGCEIEIIGNIYENSELLKSND